MDIQRKSTIIDTEDLLAIWRVFSKNWYIIVVSVLLTAGASYFYTYKLNETYAAQTQILLKSDNTYDYQNQLYKSVGYYASYQDNANQIRVITSNDLISKTLRKLKFDVSYFIIGRLKTSEVYDAMPFDVDIQIHEYSLFEKKFNLKIIDSKSCKISYIYKDREVNHTVVFDKEFSNDLFEIMIKKNELLNSKSVSSLQNIGYVFIVHDFNYLVAKYKSAITVENIENTTILEFTLEDGIAARAKTFLDTLSKVYIDYTAESQIMINENTLHNIDKQLVEVVDILNGIEDNMETYKSTEGVLNLPRQESEYFSKLIEFDEKKRNTELYIQSLEALEKYILAVGKIQNEKLLPPSFYIHEGDDYLKAALGKLYEMQMERNERLSGVTESNRGINELDQNIQLLRDNILTYIDNSKKGLKDRIKDVNSQIESYTNIIQKVPKTQRDLLGIQRKLTVNEKMYMFLLEKRANTIIARAGILPETSIIETAHSIGVVRPNKTKILYYFITVGFVIALIIIFIRTVVFATIENISELKRLTNLPVLGEVLLSNDANENYIIVDKDPKAAITESFRTIRTNLEYMASDANSKVILITSYNPGEGKTFCAVNLATILAKASKKVLLIELDLHKPKVQKALNMSSDIGVSTILIGKTEISSAIMPTEIENLSVILSGPTPPNASEIILSKHLLEIFDYGRMNFDYVIVDTGPVGLISDALIIMKHVDITLFVLNAKYAKKQVIDIAQEIVSINKVKNFGFILNSVKRKRSRYYYNYGYGSGYGYGYNSGYSYKNEKKN